MRIAGIGLLWLLLINSGNIQAATEFGENIPTRIAKIFVGIGPAEAGLYSDILDEFPPFILPAEFMVIGSVTRDIGNTVYLSTTLEDAQARQAIVQAFAAEGWQEIIFPRPPVTAGFIGDRNAAFPTMLCHDDLANMQINTTQTADELVMTINHLGGAFQQDQSCSELVANRQQSAARFQAFRDTLQQYLPRLELPLESSRGMPPGGTGGVSSSGNNEASAQTDLRSDWELPQVFEFFAAQIAAQGWMPEGTSLIGLTAGGSWTRSPAPGINLLGMLSVVKKTENTYRLEFNLISLPIQTVN